MDKPSTENHIKLDEEMMDEEEDDQLQEEEYEVERIVQHKGKKGTSGLKYLIKWKNYDDENNSWEPAKAVYAHDLIDQYWTSVQKNSPAQASNRSKKQTAKRAKVEDEEDSEDDEGMMITDGSYPGPDVDWEAQVLRVKTLEEASGGELKVFLVWREKHENGRNITTVDSMKDVRSKCPQKLIDFYESHLKFKTTDGY